MVTMTTLLGVTVGGRVVADWMELGCICLLFTSIDTHKQVNTPSTTTTRQHPVCRSASFFQPSYFTNEHNQQIHITLAPRYIPSQQTSSLAFLLNLSPRRPLER